VTKLPRDLAEDLDDLLSRAFAEDGEDVTSLAVFGPSARLAARLVCRERAVIAGAAFLPRLFAFLSPPARVAVRVADGAFVAPGTVLAEVEGPAITVLAAERTALNLLQRLSGIATKTRGYVDALKGTKAVLLDTRKTTAGLRRLERYAVRCGGGTNHRYGLAWGFLVKDNHADGAGSVWEATRRAKDFRALNKRLAGLLLEAEARTRDEVRQALDAGAERILLDNMALAPMAEAVADVALFNEATGARVTTEASGKMTPESARAAAEAGVDFVSAGAITHSIKAIDIALDVVKSAPLRRRPSAAPKALTRLLKKGTKKISSEGKRPRRPVRHRGRSAHRRSTLLLRNPKSPP
jgi:nicotinate-nucleotide pyrophosphorylase (carboxylating)